MANENICVFCGETRGVFRSTTITCAGTYQPCCWNCARELNDLSEEEQCRKALRLGLAESPEKLEAYLEIRANAETHRPSCLRCNTKLKFLPVQNLDNSPMRDGMFCSTFDVLPAYCPSCGRYEFYNPEVTEKNAYLSYLVQKDTVI